MKSDNGFRDYDMMDVLYEYAETKSGRIVMGYNLTRHNDLEWLLQKAIQELPQLKSFAEEAILYHEGGRMQEVI